MPRLTKDQRDRAHLCGVPGCSNVWASTINQPGKRCLQHMEPAATKQLPTTPPAKSWNETDKETDAEEN